MNSQLQTAIENVYAAFKDVPKPQHVDGCPCCISKEEIALLLTKPLRELMPEDLRAYSSSVFLTVGSTQDFLYFLPRILELLALGEDMPDPEIIARALKTAGYHTWSKNLSHAVFNYFDAKIAELLINGSDGWEIDSWICSLGRLQVDLNPFLQKIAASPLRLIAFYEWNSDQLVDNKLSNGFWDEAPNEHRQVVEWFKSFEIKKAVELAYGLA